MTTADTKETHDSEEFTDYTEDDEAAFLMKLKADPK
jgi:hypothetical protein